MSGVMARMILTGGFALIVAAFAYFSTREEQNRNHEHAHTNHRSGRGGGSRPRPDPDPPKNAWHDARDAPPRRRASRRDSNSSTKPASKRHQLACTICLNEFSELLDAGADICSTSCGHVFCMKCITAYIASQDHPSMVKCPICRSFFSKDSLSRVFFS